jgi:hypothetical protein
MTTKSIIVKATAQRRKKQAFDYSTLEQLNTLHYNADRVMIGHAVVPMETPSEGVFWCQVCGGHPEDPVHQPGYVE